MVSGLGNEDLALRAAISFRLHPWQQLFAIATQDKLGLPLAYSTPLEYFAAAARCHAAMTVSDQWMLSEVVPMKDS